MISALQDLLEQTSETSGTGVLLLVDAPAKGVLWRGAAGAFGAGLQPIAAGDAFRIASVTKMVTAATVLRLAEEGRVDLDGPLAGQLPARLIRDLPAGAWVRRLARVTPRLLLQQRGGLIDFFDGPHKVRAGLPALPARLATLARAYLARRGLAPRRAQDAWPPEAMLAHAMRRGDPLPAPGTRFLYADTNFVLLGLMIEAVTGAPLHRAYRELVFDPLSMDATFLEGREAARATPARVFWGRRDVSAFDPRADWAGGGLVSTLDDLRRFMRGLIGQRLFADPATFEAMATFRPVGAGAFPGLTGYGLGLARCTFAGEELVGHGGMWGAFAFASRRGDLLLIGTTNRAGSFARASRSLIEGSVAILCTGGAARRGSRVPAAVQPAA